MGGPGRNQRAAGALHGGAAGQRPARPYLRNACRRPPAGSRGRRSSGRTRACSRTRAGTGGWASSSTRSHLRGGRQVQGLREGGGGLDTSRLRPRGGEGPRSPEGTRGKREQGKTAEEVLDRDQRQTWRDRRHSKGQEKSRAAAGQDGRKSVRPREGRSCGQGKAGRGEGLGQAGTSQGSRTGSRPPVPPTDAGTAEGVPLEARLAVTAVGAGEVVAHLPLAAAVHARLTLVHVCRGRRAGHPEAWTLPLHQPPRPRAPGKPEARGRRALPTHLVPSWLAW